MTNATIQNVLSFPTLPAVRAWDSGTVSSLYRSNHWDRVPFFQNLGEAYSIDSSTVDTWPNVAHSIWHEAQRFDVLTDAHTENFSRAMLAPVDGAPLPVVVEVVQFDQDTEAALRQAELLGATADQRAKLRDIVTARFDAVRALATMTERAQAATVRALRAEAAAAEDITDPSDKRVWGIFGDAAKESKRQGYCSVYDQISEAVGIPTRDTLGSAGYLDPSRYDVEVEVTFTQRVTVTVDADSYDAAIRAGDEMSHRDIWDYLSVDSLSHHDITDTDAKEAEEASE